MLGPIVSYNYSWTVYSDFIHGFVLNNVLNSSKEDILWKKIGKWELISRHVCVSISFSVTYVLSNIDGFSFVRTRDIKEGMLICYFGKYKLIASTMLGPIVSYNYSWTVYSDFIHGLRKKIVRTFLFLKTICSKIEFTVRASKHCNTLLNNEPNISLR
jgi:hypothetical protein